MSEKLKSENGSYTIEATISLVFFMIAIMFIYSQARVIICENIMQNAVNNMSKEISSYVYILDRVGLVVNHSEEEFKEANQLIANGQDVGTQLDNFSETIGTLFGSADDITGSAAAAKDSAMSLAGSIKKFIDAFKAYSTDDLKNDLKTLAISAGESLAKTALNNAVSEYCNWKLTAYLPADIDTFCDYYMVDKNSISFKLSRIFPDNENNSILIAVEYTANSPFKAFPIKRKVIKYAYCAAWVSSNTHQIS